MRWIRGYIPKEDQSRLYRNALIITICGNIFLAVSKGIVAYLSKSVALYADAANSTSDVLYSIMMVFGLRMAQQPPDISHPQGHIRFEPLVGLLVTVSMTFAGFEAARASLMRFLQGGLAVEPGLPLLVLLVSAALKAVMFIAIRRIATRLSSPALQITAKDNLSDVLTSLAALVGTLGSRYIHPLLDPIAGFFVAAWIFRAVYYAGKENLGYLTGAGADEATRNLLVQIAEQVPGVLRVHHLMTEYVGPKLVVDLHINVDSNMTIHEAHRISDEISTRLQAMPEVDRAYVHIEPDDWKD